MSLAVRTTEHSLKTLAKVIISKLENAKHIEFNPMTRNEVRDEFYAKLAQSMLSDEALSQKIRHEIATKSGSITDANITETDAYKMRKKALQTEYEENVVAGFYLKKTFRELVGELAAFFLKADVIDEVYADDDVLKKIIQDTIATFDETKVS